MKLLAANRLLWALASSVQSVPGIISNIPQVWDTLPAVRSFSLLSYLCGEAFVARSIRMADSCVLIEKAFHSKGVVQMKKMVVSLASLLILIATFAVAGSKNPMVGGQEMYPTKDIIDNAVNSADHTTLVAAVKAAGLVDTLKGPGPFTVFAPTNEGFAKLPAGTVDTLLKPENKEMLTKILTYHVVAGKMSSKDIATAIKAGGGTASLKTVEGGTLKASFQGDSIILTDEKGGMSKITIADVYQSNGVIHVIDTVLMQN